MSSGQVLFHVSSWWVPRRISTAPFLDPSADGSLHFPPHAAGGAVSDDCTCTDSGSIRHGGRSGHALALTGTQTVRGPETPAPLRGERPAWCRPVFPAERPLRCMKVKVSRARATLGPAAFPGEHLPQT